MNKSVQQVAILPWLCMFLSFAISLNAGELLFASKEEFLDVYEPVAAKRDFLPPLSLIADVIESKDGVALPLRQIRVFARDNYLRVDDDIGGGVQVSRIASPDQSFRAVRKKPKAGFSIEPASESLKEMHNICRTTAPIVSPYYHFLETPIAEFLARSDVEIESSRRAADSNGEPFVEIDVSRVVYNDADGLDKWLYQFTFLPDKDWVLSRFRIGSELEYRFYHSSSSDGVPIISKVEIEQTGPEDYVYTATYDVTKIDLNLPSLKEFTPSAFVAVNQDGGKGKSGILVLLIAAVAVLVVMICQKRNRHRDDAG